MKKQFLKLLVTIGAGPEAEDPVEALHGTFATVWRGEKLLSMLKTVLTGNIVCGLSEIDYGGSGLSNLKLTLQR